MFSFVFVVSFPTRTAKMNRCRVLAHSTVLGCRRRAYRGVVFVVRCVTDVRGEGGRGCCCGTAVGCWGCGRRCSGGKKEKPQPGGKTPRVAFPLSGGRMTHRTHEGNTGETSCNCVDMEHCCTFGGVGGKRRQDKHPKSGCKRRAAVPAASHTHNAHTMRPLHGRINAQASAQT